MTTRPPAVAGTFYPNDPVILAETIDHLLAAVSDPGPPPKALIVPHAGYRYSGPVAASGYACLPAVAEQIERVVLLGPCHYFAAPGLVLPQADRLATPLGPVPLWADGAAIVGAFEQVIASRVVHAREHSLEVQLPFLLRTLRQFEVLPLAVGPIEPAAVAEVIEAVWGGSETLIVVSSDLSHYLPFDAARVLDAGTIEQILALDGPIDSDQACGAFPVSGLLAAAPAHQLGASLVDARNSGDTAGDRSRVVGYATIRFDEPPRSSRPALASPQ